MSEKFGEMWSRCSYGARLSENFVSIMVVISNQVTSMRLGSHETSWFRGRQFFHRLGRGEGGGGGGMVRSVMRVMGSYREQQMKLPSLAAHLLLCSPVPNRPQPRGWGPLLQRVFKMDGWTRSFKSLPTLL